MYNQFNPDNLYTGWDASQNVVDAGNFPNSYEYFIGNGSSNVFFGSNDAKLKLNHERICDDCVASSDYRALVRFLIRKFIFLKKKLK